MLYNVQALRTVPLLDNHHVICDNYFEGYSMGCTTWFEDRQNTHGG